MSDTGVTPTNALDLVRTTFPWIQQLGIDPSLLQQWASEGVSNGEMLVGRIRELPQWRSRFVGIRRPDGTLRMNEAEYFRQEDGYRQILRQYGRPGYEYNDPNDYVAFFNNEIDPNELRDRMRVYRELETSGRDVRDAFYVYAGMRLSTDDLYEVVVNPDRRAELQREYTQRVAASPLDYQTWVTRATEAGLQRVTDTLNELRGTNTVTGQAIERIMSVSPDFARQMMDVLYTGGQPGGQQLGLAELMSSFELAMIGGVASELGLSMPSRERVQALRAAGVDRARARQGYSQFAQQADMLDAMVRRAQGGGPTTPGFTQSDFEDAVFLQRADTAQLLDRAQRLEQSLGERQSTSAFSFDRQGRLTQRSMRPL